MLSFWAPRKPLSSPLREQGKASHPNVDKPTPPKYPKSSYLLTEKLKKMWEKLTTTKFKAKELVDFYSAFCEEYNPQKTGTRKKDAETHGHWIPFLKRIGIDLKAAHYSIAKALKEEGSNREGEGVVSLIDLLVLEALCIVLHHPANVFELANSTSTALWLVKIVRSVADFYQIHFYKKAELSPIGLVTERILSLCFRAAALYVDPLDSWLRNPVHLSPSLVGQRSPRRQGNHPRPTLFSPIIDGVAYVIAALTSSDDRVHFKDSKDRKTSGAALLNRERSRLGLLHSAIMLSGALCYVDPEIRDEFVSKGCHQMGLRILRRRPFRFSESEIEKSVNKNPLWISWASWEARVLFLPMGSEMALISSQIIIIHYLHCLSLDLPEVCSVLVRSRFSTVLKKILLRAAESLPVSSPGSRDHKALDAELASLPTTNAMVKFLEVEPNQGFQEQWEVVRKGLEDLRMQYTPGISTQDLNFSCYVPRELQDPKLRYIFGHLLTVVSIGGPKVQGGPQSSYISQILEGLVKLFTSIRTPNPSPLSHAPRPASITSRPASVTSPHASVTSPSIPPQTSTPISALALARLRFYALSTFNQVMECQPRLTRSFEALGLAPTLISATIAATADSKVSAPTITSTTSPTSPTNPRKEEISDEFITQCFQLVLRLGVTGVQLEAPPLVLFLLVDLIQDQWGLETEQSKEGSAVSVLVSGVVQDPRIAIHAAVAMAILLDVQKRHNLDISQHHEPLQSMWRSIFKVLEFQAKKTKALGIPLNRVRPEWKHRCVGLQLLSLLLKPATLRHSMLLYCDNISAANETFLVTRMLQEDESLVTDFAGNIFVELIQTTPPSDERVRQSVQHAKGALLTELMSVFHTRKVQQARELSLITMLLGCIRKTVTDTGNTEDEPKKFCQDLFREKGCFVHIINLMSHIMPHEKPHYSTRRGKNYLRYQRQRYKSRHRQLDAARDEVPVSPSFREHRMSLLSATPSERKLSCRPASMSEVEKKESLAVTNQVIRTLILLMKQNPESQRYFKQDIFGYKFLQSTLIHFVDAQQTRELYESLFDFLVMGKFCPLHRFVIRNPDIIPVMFDMLPALSIPEQVEFLECFTHIVSSSVLNQEHCCRAEVINQLLDMIPHLPTMSIDMKENPIRCFCGCSRRIGPGMVTRNEMHSAPFDLLLGSQKKGKYTMESSKEKFTMENRIIEIIRVIGMHSITVPQLKKLFRVMKSVDTLTRKPPTFEPEDTTATSPTSPKALLSPLEPFPLKKMSPEQSASPSEQKMSQSSENSLSEREHRGSVNSRKISESRRSSRTSKSDKLHVVTTRPAYNPAILSAIEKMYCKAGRVSPLNFWHLEGSTISGLKLPTLKWPRYGAAISLWVRIESSLKEESSPCVLLHLSSNDEKAGGIQFLVTDDVFKVAISHPDGSKGSIPPEDTESDGKTGDVDNKSTSGKGARIYRRRWYNIVVSFDVYISLARARRGSALVSVNGALTEHDKVTYPTFTADLTKCFLGWDGKDGGFDGQLGPVYLFKESLTAEEAKRIYEMGPEHNFSYQSMDSMDVVMSKKVLHAYNAKASTPQGYTDNSPNNDFGSEAETYAHALFPGTHVCITRHIKDVLQCLGGIQVLFPICEQLDLPVRVVNRAPVVIQNGEVHVDEKTNELLLESDSDSSDDEYKYLHVVHLVSYDPDPEYVCRVMRLVRIIIVRDLTNEVFMRKNRGFALLAFVLEKLSPISLTTKVALEVDHLLAAISGKQDLVRSVYWNIMANCNLWLYTPEKTQETWILLLRQHGKIFLGDPDKLAVQKVLDQLRTICWYTPEAGSLGVSQNFHHPITGELIGSRSSDPSAIRPIRAVFLHFVQKRLESKGTVEDLKVVLMFLEHCQDPQQQIEVLDLLMTVLIANPKSVCRLAESIPTTPEDEQWRMSLDFPNQTLVGILLNVMAGPDPTVLLKALQVVHIFHTSGLSLSITKTTRQVRAILLKNNQKMDIEIYAILLSFLLGVTMYVRGDPGKTTDLITRTLDGSHKIKVKSVLPIILDLAAEADLAVSQIVMQHVSVILSDNRNRKIFIFDFGWQKRLLAVVYSSHMKLEALAEEGWDEKGDRKTGQTVMSRSKSVSSYTVVSTYGVHVLQTLLFFAIKHETNGWQHWRDAMSWLVCMPLPYTPYVFECLPGTERFYGVLPMMTTLLKQLYRLLSREAEVQDFGSESISKEQTKSLDLLSSNVLRIVSHARKCLISRVFEVSRKSPATVAPPQGTPAESSDPNDSKETLAVLNESLSTITGDEKLPSQVSTIWSSELDNVWECTKWLSEVESWARSYAPGNGGQRSPKSFSRVNSSRSTLANVSSALMLAVSEYITSEESELTNRLEDVIRIAVAARRVEEGRQSSVFLDTLFTSKTTRILTEVLKKTIDAEEDSGDVSRIQNSKNATVASVHEETVKALLLVLYPILNRAMEQKNMQDAMNILPLIYQVLRSDVEFFPKGFRKGLKMLGNFDPNSENADAKLKICLDTVFRNSTWTKFFKQLTNDRQIHEAISDFLSEAKNEANIARNSIKAISNQHKTHITANKRAMRILQSKRSDGYAARAKAEALRRSDRSTRMNVSKRIRLRSLQHVVRSLSNERGPWCPYNDTDREHGTCKEKKVQSAKRRKRRRQYKMVKRPRVYWKLDKVETIGRIRNKLKVHYSGSSHKGCKQKTTADRKKAEEKEKEEEEQAMIMKAVKVSLPLLKDDVKNKTTQRPHKIVFRDLVKQDEELEDDTKEIDAEEVVGNLLRVTCVMMTPAYQTPGFFLVTNTHVHFEVDEVKAAEKDENRWVVTQHRQKWEDSLPQGYDRRWEVSSIRAVMFRRKTLRPTALEVFFEDNTNCFFNFESSKVRSKVYRKICSVLPDTERVGVVCFTDIKESPYHFMYKRSQRLMASPQRLIEKSGLTKLWQERKLSNFDYLMMLNTIAGRTYNDLSQYPVMPWVIKDYESQTLNLNDPSIYRDLSKPIGALNPERLEKEFLSRYEEWDVDMMKMPPFMYGTHYSTAGYVLFYMIRTEPYTTQHICLQSGHFDNPNRLFHSIETAWKGCQSSLHDVKELIPEWYYQPEIFRNINGFDMGTRDSGQTLGDVILPPWARTPEEFVRISRTALESEFVSANLHNWIDLIFGDKQQGLKAEKAFNVFGHHTYENAIDLDAIEDEAEKNSILTMIEEFGQCPSQLFTKPHPKRFVDDILDLSVISKLNAIKMYVHKPGVASSKLVCLAVRGEAVISIGAERFIGVHRWRNATSDFIPPFHFDVERKSRSRNRRLTNVVRSMQHDLDSRVLAVSKDGKVIFSCGHWDNSFKISLVETGKVFQSIVQHKDVVSCLAVSANNRVLVTGSKDTTVMVWNHDLSRHLISPLHPTHILYGHDDEVSCIAVNVELDVVVSGSKDGTCIIHTLRKGNYVRSIYSPGRSIPIRWVGISPTGYVITYLKATRSLHSYSINGRLLHSSEFKMELETFLISKHGEYVLVGGSRGHKGVLKVISCHSLKVKLREEKPSCVHSIALSEGEAHLLVGMKDGSVEVHAINESHMRKVTMMKLQMIGF